MTILTQEPLCRVFTIWADLVLGHHYYIFSLYNVYPGEEKKIFKEIAHFHYMTYGHAQHVHLAQEPLPRG